MDKLNFGKMGKSKTIAKIKELGEKDHEKK